MSTTKRTLCIIPARMGSKRLPKKNLRTLGGISLIARAIRKARAAGCFDEIWVSSENNAFEEIAFSEGVQFDRRDDHLGSDSATSEDYISDFLQRHDAEYLVQLHSITPLVSITDVVEFTHSLTKDEFDSLFTVTESTLEVLFEDIPLNFSFSKKTNSQELRPVSEISWALTGWNIASFRESISAGKCATYSGRLGFVDLPKFVNHAIKTEADLNIAEALLNLGAERGPLL